MTPTSEERLAFKRAELQAVRDLMCNHDVEAIRAEATAAAEQRLRALEGALRRLDHIARVFPQSLGEERELDAALDESYRLLHPDSPEKP